MSRRRHERTRLSQCAREEMASSRGIGSLEKVYGAESLGLGKAEAGVERAVRLYGLGGGGEGVGSVVMSWFEPTRHVVVVVVELSNAT